MKYKLITISLLFISTSLFSQRFFDKVVDSEWKGTGTLMKNPSNFTMHWTRALKKKFFKLEFANNFITSEAYYTVANDSIVEGYWFDTRGTHFPLKGTVSDNKLEIFWGSTTTEQGKTVYTMNDNTIEVIDYVLSNNKYAQFGNASYKKQ